MRISLYWAAVALTSNDFVLSPEDEVAVMR